MENNGKVHDVLCLTIHWNISEIPYSQKFSRESNFRYFRERFENAKICLREKLYFERKFRSWYRYDIFAAYPV